MSICATEKAPCQYNSDCTKAKNKEINIDNSQCTVVGNGTKKIYGCTFKQWCPSREGTREIHYIKDFHKFNILLNSFLPSDFGIQSSLDSSDGKQVEYPHQNPTSFKIHDLLRKAGILDNTIV